MFGRRDSPVSSVGVDGGIVAAVKKFTLFMGGLRERIFWRKKIKIKNPPANTFHLLNYLIALFPCVGIGILDESMVSGRTPTPMWQSCVMAAQAPTVALWG